ncbi:MAG: cation:proton antiporter [Candidatus Krumholzibacteriia bacterium]|nr:cation:proton antiporter [Candidatus Latescibacterota bacterium]
MPRRLVLIGLLVLLAWLAERALLPMQSASLGRESVALGFLLLSAFLLGEMAPPLRLPRISGYLLAGVLFGPDALGLVGADSLERLKVIDSLALTFIALSAGGELSLGELRRGRRLLGWGLATQLTLIFLVSGLLVVAASPLFAFTRDLGPAQLWVMAALLGAIATARSPASAIAIIKETKSQGPFTEAALGLTVAMDILSIVLFAVVLSVGGALLSGGPLDLATLGGLLLELGSSLALGALLGAALAAWLRRVSSHHLITLFLVAIVVSEASHALAHWLDVSVGASFHLEPMLICIAMGFVVRNFSAHGQGDAFLEAIERGGLTVYALFFALAGAALDLGSLRSTWMLAVLLVAIRFASIQGSSWLGARLAGAPATTRRNLGLTFVTQAGVSLGLARALAARFPDWGPAVATLAVASISLNQLLGPVLFKRALDNVGEAGAAAQPAPARPRRHVAPARVVD